MVVSGLALALLGPVMLLVGMIIRRETGGSVLFHQRRIGKDGREFNLLKFQTLVPRDAAEGDTDWNIAQDDRPVLSVACCGRRASTSCLSCGNVLQRRYVAGGSAS